jgi:glycosyltransferase involved in cell wall biosynthesis
MTTAKVTFVVIGRNEEKNLGRCLESVLRQIAGSTHDVIYVDSRSTDRSVEIARGFAGVRVHVLEDQKPSAAKARNAGWRLATDATFVHFVDGDTVLADGWLLHALQAIADPKVGAVFGRFREMHPEASVYNKVADLDWPRDNGPVETFGGIVLVRRTCLVEADGFDERLRVGEDPALALEIRRRGHAILQIEPLMAWHDIDLHSFRAYWKRNVMVGWSMAEISYRNRGHAVSAWAGKTLRTLVLLLGGLAILALGILVTPWLLAAGILLAGLDLLRIARNNLRRAGNWADAIVYAMHARTIMFPVAIGHWKWYRERPRD